MTRFWDEARVAVYGALRRGLPLSVRDWIGGSSFTAPLRRAILGDHAQTAVDFHGYPFEIAGPVKMIASIREHGGIENGLCRLVLEQCRPGAIALDVGANYGFVTLVMAHAVGAAGQVHSFEADREIHEALTANVERNEVGSRCTVVRGFVGNRDEGERLSIDAYVAKKQLPRVDFLKIDVDGPDFEVLQGARDTLARFRPVVAIEITDREQQIVELLQGLGYTCTDMKGTSIDPAHWPPNVLAAVGRRLQVPARSADLRR